MQLLRQGYGRLGPVFFHIHASLGYIALQKIRGNKACACMCRVSLSDVWCIIQEAKLKLLQFMEQSAGRMCPCTLQCRLGSVNAGRE